jgi:hypothetical protein
MFTALFSIFKAEPEHDHVLDQANEALQERMDHMLRQGHIARRVVTRETYSNPLVNKRVSIRRAIAA